MRKIGDALARRVIVLRLLVVAVSAGRLILVLLAGGLIVLRSARRLPAIAACSCVFVLRTSVVRLVRICRRIAGGDVVGGRVLILIFGSRHERRRVWLCGSDLGGWTCRQLAGRLRG